MGTITVRVSDFTGQMIEDERQAARVVVEQHPDFDEPIVLEALPEEIEGELPEETNFVALSYQAPGEPVPRRVLMPLAEFNLLFKQTEPEVVLQQALESQREREGRTRRRGRRAGREPRKRVDYTAPQHAGEPHRGRITNEERDYVREHLDEVNARLREKNLREIDPTDPQMQERYGLTQELVEEPVEEAEVVEEPPRA